MNRRDTERTRWQPIAILVAVAALVVSACGGGATPSPTAGGPSPSAGGASPSAGGASPSGSAAEEIGAPETASITLGVRTGNIGSVAPLFIARDRGYYEEEGLNVEIIVTDQVQEGIVGGSLNVGIFDPDATVESIHEGVPLIMVAGNRQREPLIIAAAAGIESAEDLAGKDVALGLGPGDPATNFRLEALKAAGWDLEAVEGIQYVSPPGGSDARAELLYAGQVALTYVFPRHKQPAEEAGGTLIVDDYLDPFLNDVFITTEDFASANTNTLAHFIRATIRGKQDFLDLSQKDAVLELMEAAGFEVGENERAFYEFDPPQHDEDMAIPQEGYERLLEASGVEDPGFEEVTSLDALHLAQRSLGLPER